ncbi:general secretion pathway protein GspF [Alphaproteobacteria bacterium]|nr:general secretion pathway protein GspF [Alphaproteobacteria bacterium]GHS95591.1 general secretion pathway protein GspF [Alphaproteobacteria bacterium]
MPLFYYEAVDGRGSLIKGVENAENKNALKAYLEKQNLTPLSVRAHFFENFASSAQKIVELRNFFLQLATLLAQKMTLKDALEILEALPDVGKRNMAHQILGQIQQGLLFSEALAKNPALFPPFAVNSLKNSENTGSLEENCRMMGLFFETQRDLKSRKRKALAYPLFVGGATLSFLFLTLYVLVPQIRTFQDAPSAPEQKVLFVLSDAFVAHPGLSLLTLVGIPLGIWGWRYLWKRKRLGANKGPATLDYDGILWLKTLALLLRSGIMTKEALVLSQQHIQVAAFKKTVGKLVDRVVQGEALHQALEKTQGFPKSAAKFAEIGENCGALGALLEQCATLEMQRLTEKTDRRLAHLQPALLVFAGGFLLWIVLSLFLPLYENFSERF